ncbi:hypothetical protein OHV05_37315 (plasmid) [Kitasatospora sp. NBC_00070]|uniref:hypothetical protein n=1 Tax=Kitasatospora sp. NBC_00070 TaxID=2975962 RepID=UPI002F9085AF
MNSSLIRSVLVIVPVLAGIALASPSYACSSSPTPPAPPEIHFATPVTGPGSPVVPEPVAHYPGETLAGPASTAILF